MTKTKDEGTQDNVEAAPNPRMVFIENLASVDEVNRAMEFSKSISSPMESIASLINQYRK
jgi:hypothetical protein